MKCSNLLQHITVRWLEHIYISNFLVLLEGREDRRNTATQCSTTAEVIVECQGTLSPWKGLSKHWSTLRKVSTRGLERGDCNILPKCFPPPALQWRSRGENHSSLWIIVWFQGYKVVQMTQRPFRLVYVVAHMCPLGYAPRTLWSPALCTHATRGGKAKPEASLYSFSQELVGMSPEWLYHHVSGFGMCKWEQKHTSSHQYRKILHGSRFLPF